MLGNFTQKGYGRIYVNNDGDINKLKKIIKEIDEFEYDYLTSDFIANISEYPNLVPTGKFDIDMRKVSARCFLIGMPILVIDNGHDEFIDNPVLINKEPK